MKPHLYPATENDVSLIEDLARRTWPSTFGAILAREQIEYMLRLMYSPEALLEQMRRGHRFWLAASAAGQAAQGYASCEPLPHALKIHKLYVTPDSQGKGLGKALLLHLAEQAPHLPLSLNVNRFNRPAIDFYRRLGLTVVRQEIIDIGGGFVMDDFVMEGSVLKF